MVTARIPLFRNTVIEKGGYNTKRSLASSFRKKKKLKGLTLESAKMDMLKKTNITQDFRLRLHAKNLNLFQRWWATAKINYLGIELNSHISISIATEKKILSPPFYILLHDAARRLRHHRTKPRLAFLISNHIKKIVHSRPVLNCFGESHLAFHMPQLSSIVF